MATDNAMIRVREEIGEPAIAPEIVRRARSTGC